MRLLLNQQSGEQQMQATIAADNRGAHTPATHRELHNRLIIAGNDSIREDVECIVFQCEDFPRESVAISRHPPHCLHFSWIDIAVRQ